MSRSTALRLAAEYFDSGRFQRDLQRRIALPTESQNAARADELAAYLREEIAPALAALGFETQQIANPVEGAPPLLLARRIESADAVTVLMYGHGDVVNGRKAAGSRTVRPGS